MKKCALSLLLVPLFSHAAVSLDIQTTCNDMPEKRNLILTHEPQAITIEDYTVHMYATEEPACAVIGMKIFKNGEEEPVCSPEIRAPWNEPQTFVCPKEDTSAQVTITATQISS